MGCCTDTTTTGAGAAAVDTGKRVNYTQGMLLGVDDFVQEQAWGIARRHELARELLGYGTVRGLEVFVEPHPAPSGPPRVHVTPGMAWMPSGAPVCVSGDQCAGINEWLAANEKKFAALVSGTAAPLTLHVVLAYAALPCDPVPVPGEPCRDESALTQDSRIADCFRLELRTAPPRQIEEDAVRDFADWLARVPVDRVSPPLPEQAFMDQLREAARDWLEPVSPHPRDYMFGSPPPGLESTDGLLRAALRLWATELRPLWREKFGCGPFPAAPGGDDDALLLASLDLALVKGAKWEAQGDVGVRQQARPVLMSLRMVQELIAQNPAPEPATTVVSGEQFQLEPSVGIDTAYARADHSHGTPTLPDLAGDAVGPIGNNRVQALRGHAIAQPGSGFAVGDVLVFDNAEQWAPLPLPVASDDKPAALTFGGEADPGSAAAYARADHVHPVPELPPLPELEGDATGALDKTQVVALRGRALADIEPRDGQALVFNRRGGGWAPGAVSATIPPFGGDLGGNIGSEFVARLRGVPLAATAPGPGQVLGFDGSSWTPILLPPPVIPPPGGDLTGSLADATIASLQRVPLKAEAPQQGNVLAFNGSAWVPTPAAGGGTESLVEAVAAGSATLTVTRGRPLVRITQASGPVEGKINNFGGTQAAIDLNCGRIANADGVRQGFVVKLTPVWNPELPVATALVSVAPGGPDTIACSLVLFAGKDFPTDGRWSFQFEIGRFVPR
jgi:hypothetical protein